MQLGRASDQSLGLQLAIGFFPDLGKSRIVTHYLYLEKNNLKVVFKWSSTRQKEIFLQGTKAVLTHWLCLLTMIWPRAYTPPPVHHRARVPLMGGLDPCTNLIPLLVLVS